MANEKNRKLYKIGHLTKLLGITSRTIRYYDQFGLMPHVKRSEGNVRLFDEEDVEIIKKVRKMQKEEFLPLEVIRQRLFGQVNTQVSHECVVVTDGMAALPENAIRDLNVQVVPFDIVIKNDTVSETKIDTDKLWKRRAKDPNFPQLLAPSEKKYLTTYQKLAQQGYKRVYVVVSSAAFSESLTHAQTAAYKMVGDLEVTVIDAHTMGGAQGLLAYDIAAAISENQSVQQIELLISKQQPLVFSVLMATNLNNMLEWGENRNPHSLIRKTVSFVPVFTTNLKEGDFTLQASLPNEKEAMEKIEEILVNEGISRGGYFKQIVISYAHHYALAEQLMNMLKNHYKKAPIHIVQSNPSVSLLAGEEHLMISVI